PQWLALLREYHREHGHADVPQRYRAPDGRQLGHWLARQRQALASGTLAAGQAAALAELGVTRSPHDAAWDRGLAHATAYHAAHGHLNVPFSWTSEDGFPLGHWLGTNRKKISAGTLDPGRAAKLEALGFRTQARTQAAFQRGLDHLDAYIAEHGHARVSVGYTCPDGYRLGSWISNKRTVRHTLPAAGKAALDGRGMIWDARPAGTAGGPARLSTGQPPPAPAQPRPPAARDAAPDPAPRHQEDPRP
ncbi:MAG TPA: helicase associated domain-containing protein, partial [Streptosporangiaceae bacterium]